MTDEQSALGTLAEVVGTLAARLVVADESKGTATPGERIGPLRGAIEDAFALAQRRMMQSLMTGGRRAQRAACKTLDAGANS